jgi:hypothetical protein
MFFHEVVSKRRPCILFAKQQQQQQQDSHDIAPPGCNLRPSELIPSLRRLAGTKQVQVEKRCSSKESFGQNRTTTRQVEMTLYEFLDIMTTTRSANHDAEMLYLSPQQHKQKGSDHDQSNKSSSKAVVPDDPFTTPCQELVQDNSIPRHLEWAGNLILHQCNLWIGQSKEGSSSGLHNDFHDNFYLLFQGRKRFRLFPPQCAPNMYTYGKLERIHPNGLCSYAGHELRADGVPLAVLAAFEEQRHDAEHDANRTDQIDPSGLDDDDDDEESGKVIIGKGFDYRSSDEDNSDEGLFDQDVDDYDELVADETSEEDEIDENETQHIHATGSDQRPDHFSRIDPMLFVSDKRDVLAQEFPLFSQNLEYVVELEAGQILYLPASWFHEVTSMGGGGGHESNELSSSPTHIALNYWYYPPDALDNYENPYQDDFWKRMTGKTG